MKLIIVGEHNGKPSFIEWLRNHEDYKTLSGHIEDLIIRLYHAA